MLGKTREMGTNMGLMIMYQYFFINCDKHTVVSKAMITEETEYGAYANSLYYFHNFSGILYYIKYKTTIKKFTQANHVTLESDRVGSNVTSVRP